MSKEDPFTSIKWDRDDGNKPKEEYDNSAIPEEAPAETSDNDEQPNPAPEQDFPVETSTIALAQTPISSPKQIQEPETQAEESTAEAHVLDTVSQPSSPSHTEVPDAAEQDHQVPPSVENNLEEEELRQLEMSQSFDKYTIDLEVSQPISDRDGNAKQFISYLITTTTNHPLVLKLSTIKPEEGRDTITVKIRRRYGDFRFLHNCLINDFPLALVPPLPPKSNFKYFTGDTFSTSFVHKRLHSLNTFLKFICQHRYLSQLSVFHYFISDSSEWSTFTKNLSVTKNGPADESEAGGLGVVGKVVNEELLTETVMNFFTSSKHKRENNKDILEISDKLKKLYENLIKLDKIFSKLNRKHADLKLDYEQFSVQIKKLAAIQNATTQTSESAKTNPNNSLNSISGDIPILQNNFTVFSDSLLYFSEHWSSLHRYVDESFLVSLKDCAKYIIRLTELIELQHNKKIDLQVLRDYLSKAKADLAGLGGPAGGKQGPAPSPVMVSPQRGLVNNTTQLIKDTISTSATASIGSTHSNTKKQKLQQRVTQLEIEIKSQTQLVNHLTNRIINEEYPNWDKFNKRLLKKSMVDLCDQEIDFYKKLVDNWSDVESKLIMRLEELS